jgi:hypothetical protein
VRESERQTTTAAGVCRRGGGSLRVPLRRAVAALRGLVFTMVATPTVRAADLWTVTGSSVTSVNYW